MRTTLVLDDALLREAKRKAAGLGITLSQLVNDALRSALTKPPASRAGEFKMITYGDPNEALRHEPEDFAAVEAAEDLERLRKK